MSNGNLKIFDRDRFDPKRFPVFGLYFRRYAPFKRFGSIGTGNFEGDDRVVSTSPKATSRIWGVVMFDRRGRVYMEAGTSGSTFYPYSHNEWLFGGPAPERAEIRYDISLTATNGLGGPGLFGFAASTAGHNPLLPAAPDINTDIKAGISFALPNKMLINCDIFGDTFPNLEVFLLCYKTQKTALLFDGRTQGGPNLGPARLIGRNAHVQLGKFNNFLVLNERGEMHGFHSVAPTILIDLVAAQRERERMWH